MVQDPLQHMSIAARIAALKIDQIGRQGPESAFESEPRLSTTTTTTTRPPNDLRRKTTNNPPLQNHGPASAQRTGNLPNGSGAASILPPSSPPITARPPSRLANKPSLPPRLPPRTQAARPVPVLPPRKPSDHGMEPKRSDEPWSSDGASSSRSRSANPVAATGPTTSSRSSSVDLSANRVRAPAYDPATLPPLPPKRHPSPRPQAEPSVKETSNPTARRLPPRVPPSRGSTPVPISHGSASDERKQDTTGPQRPAAPLIAGEPLGPRPAIPSSKPSVLRPAVSSVNMHDVAPPVPLASKPKPSASSAGSSSTITTPRCLKCRDFSGPDAHAARFPRQSLPTTSIEWLAYQLCGPFPSATDKARVIFTWLHHNVEYDVESFFNDAVQPSTPSGVIGSGLAVCEGYAGVFNALATQSGLESVVVGGHGKGYGHTAPGAHSAVPARSSNHAWNAVKLDDGAWKLIDSCWGAGVVNGAGQPYSKRLNTTFFTMDNADFALRHFPDHPAFFHLPTAAVADGRRPPPAPTWEEYMLGDGPGRERPQVFSGVQDEHGISETSFTPARKRIVVPSSSSSSSSRAPVRFQFAAVCPHWQHETMGGGTPYVFVLAVHGPGGARDDFLPFETDAGRRVWWCDVPSATELGVPGQSVTLFAVTTVDGCDARAWTADLFRQAKGRKAMGFAGVAAWELV
ncbi:MAG: hypothetical protein M1826_000169 [Phylliscum demangeonii]|nr:MAG: hypothetical protein M1826_000169 [Phylliscum demangeonii]